MLKRKAIDVDGDKGNFGEGKCPGLCGFLFYWRVGLKGFAGIKNGLEGGGPSFVGISWLSEGLRVMIRRHLLINMDDNLVPGSFGCDLWRDALSM